MIVFEALHDMVNGCLFENTLREFPAVTDDTGSLICDPKFKNFHGTKHDLTKYVKDNRPELIDELGNPSEIVSKGIAIELVYELDTMPPHIEQNDPTNGNSYEVELAKIMFELRFGNIANWSPYQLLRLEVFQIYDEDLYKTSIKHKEFLKVSENIFTGTHVAIDLIQFDWSGVSYAVNPIITRPISSLSYPENEILLGLVISPLYIAELFNVWNMCGDALVHSYLSKYSMYRLVWEFMRKKGVVRRYVQFDKNVILDLLDNYNDSTKVFVVEDDTPEGKAIRRIWGGNRFDYLTEVLNNYRIYKNLMLSGIEKCGNQSHHILKDFNNEEYDILRKRFKVRWPELKEPFLDFGSRLEDIVATLLSELEIEAVMKGVIIAVLLGIISVVLSIISISIVVISMNP
ncbi:MAG: hypothetical protein KGD60_07750 [Candidatus Thorarchaeota archaeon]|nr:hypothetical protein [Candidatus Thorarchaeota archaeon]